MWEFTCPICKTDTCVLPMGPKSSPVLILGDKPGVQEIKEGKPFVGATGSVLRTELSRVGIDLATIRVTNMWLHAPNKNEKCQEHGVKQAMLEAKGKKVILLIGSDTVRYFCKVSVEEWNGLVVVSNWFPDAKVMVSVQPATAFHGCAGEVKFALAQFAELLKKENLL